LGIEYIIGTRLQAGHNIASKLCLHSASFFQKLLLQMCVVFELRDNYKSLFQKKGVFKKIFFFFANAKCPNHGFTNRI